MRTQDLAATLPTDTSPALTGPAPVWLGGGFVSHNAEDVPAIQLVYLCRDPEHLGALLRTDGIYQLLTLQSVFAERPIMVSIAELQPVGGLVPADRDELSERNVASARG